MKALRGGGNACTPLRANELEAAKRKIQILQQGKDGEIEVVDVPEGTFSEES